MQAVHFQRVMLDDPFWSPRLQISSSSALLHQWQQLELSGCINNFRLAAGLGQGFHSGWFFADSDAYKWLDAAARFSFNYANAAVSDHLQQLILLIESAQSPDGYLYTYNQLLFPSSRWQNLQIEHELYCHGHLIEAGIAHYQATQGDTLLQVATRAADLICDTFLGKGPQFTPGHEEIEIALLRLFQLNGHERYLEMATQFLEQRGGMGSLRFGSHMLRENARVTRRTKIRKHQLSTYQREHPNQIDLAMLAKPNQVLVPRWSKERFLLSGLTGKYFQQHAPIRQQSRASGHAVRFAYLQTAITMLINLRGDYSLMPAVIRRWTDVISKKSYISAGTGSLPLSEAFGRAYELDPAIAYAETCAALGSMFWNWEMTLLKADAAYADLFERLLYNAALVGIGQNMICYLYNNPLENKNGLKRKPWFEIPCCPSNLARTWAALPGYIYTHDGDALWIHQFIGSTFEYILPSGNPVSIKLDSSLPWQGDVKLSIDPPEALEFTVNIRIPSWCQEVSVTLNGNEYYLGTAAAQNYDATASGYDPREAQYVALRRTWQPGDELAFNFSMPITLQYPHPRVKSCRGKVAITRGPLLYCLEAEDNPHIDIFKVNLMSSNLSARFNEQLFGGVTVIEGFSDSGQPLTLIPYAWWANRADTRMVVYVGIAT